LFLRSYIEVIRHPDRAVTRLRRGAGDAPARWHDSCGCLLLGRGNDRGAGSFEAKFYAKEIEKGGILVGVYAHNDRIEVAQDTLSAAGADKVTHC